jgi:hypothetical protein
MPPTQQYLPTPFHPQYFTGHNSTLMTSYSGPLFLPSTPVVLSLPWTATPTGVLLASSSFVGVSGDVMTSNIIVD